MVKLLKDHKLAYVDEELLIIHYEIREKNPTYESLVVDDEKYFAKVREYMDSLPEKDRQIFLRHYYYGQTVADISREMKMPESTVKSRLRRGREKMKEYLIGRDF